MGDLAVHLLFLLNCDNKLSHIGLFLLVQALIKHLPPLKTGWLAAVLPFCAPARVERFVIISSE